MGQDSEKGMISSAANFPSLLVLYFDATCFSLFTTNSFSLFHNFHHFRFFIMMSSNHGGSGVDCNPNSLCEKFGWRAGKVLVDGWDDGCWLMLNDLAMESGRAAFFFLNCLDFDVAMF